MKNVLAWLKEVKEAEELSEPEVIEESNKLTSKRNWLTQKALQFEEKVEDNESKIK